MSEDVKIVQKHARYHKQNPPDNRYSLRWPPSNSKAFFSNDAADLVKQLLEKAVPGGMRSNRAVGE